MNVSCTSCSAKYALPDEKVRGKKVKITCKHCGTGIIVDGTKLDAAAATPGTLAPAATAPAHAPLAAKPLGAAPAPPAAKEPEAGQALAAATAPQKAATTPSPAPAAVAAAAAVVEEPRFDIAYPDDRQETLSIAEIVDKYASGALDDDAFIWREGMSDWRAAFDIPEIARALGARGLSKSEPEPPLAEVAGSPFIDDDEATRIQSSPFDDPSSSSVGVWREPGKDVPSSPAAAFELQRSALPFEQPEPAASPKPAALSPRPAAAAAGETPKPSAARRSAARGGGDLFGDLAAAGSEEDESLGSETKEAAPKLTGARNESSVLFSLDALVKQEQKPAAKKPAAKQEDAAAFLLGTDSAEDSLANVGTGSFGASSFGSAFAAPDFTAPVAPLPEVRASDPVELPTAAPRAKKKGVGLWIGIAAVVLLAGGAFAMGLPSKLMPRPAPTPSAAPSPAATPEPAPTPAPQASAADAVPATSGAPSAAPPATPAAPAKPADAAKPSDKPADANKPADAAKPADADKPADKPAEPVASDAPPFDKAAAIAALSSAAGNAGSCKTPDGPTGGGKVSITFMPSGRATNTQVSGDLAGTAVGGCVARLFRSSKVPAFSGEPVTVSKSFTVQ